VSGALLSGTIVSGQVSPSGITGKITDPDSSAVEGALVQATNKATGVIYKTTSSAAGVYTVSPLAAGEYELSVPTIGFTLDRFERKDISIQPGQTVRLDVQLSWSFNLGTPGDDLSGFIRNLHQGLSGPAPRTPDGKPDLTGVWLGNDDPNPEQPSPQPWAAAIGKARIENGNRDHPSGFCLPGGAFLSGPFLIRFVQTPTLLVQLFENPPGGRQVYLDGRLHPKDRDPSWMGHSTGKWDGDTLVVDTVGFNDKNWLDVYPQTEKLHVIERYRRTDLAHLEVEITVEDPGSLTKPWRIRSTWNLTPGEEIEEYICSENNKDVQHLTTK
jgi:hypothetical protein